MAKTSPGEFIRQVRQETSKVTWPSRKELGISVVMVFIMVFIASMFFLLVDPNFGVDRSPCFGAWGARTVGGALVHRPRLFRL